MGMKRKQRKGAKRPRAVDRDAPGTAQRKPKRSAGVFRIGCIGDSNTFGTDLAPEDKYPSKLQRLLDAHTDSAYQFEVQNFGRTGATACEGEKCYMHENRFGNAIAYNAHTYVIMLGTNDAWHANHDPTDSEAGLSELVQRLRRAVPGCTVVLVQPPGSKDGRCISQLEGILHPAIRRLAATEQAGLVEPVLVPGVAYLKDQVHLSSRGAQVIAEAVAEKILAERALAAHQQPGATVASTATTSEGSALRSDPHDKVNVSVVSEMSGAMPDVDPKAKAKTKVKAAEPTECPTALGKSGGCDIPVVPEMPSQASNADPKNTTKINHAVPLVPLCPTAKETMEPDISLTRVVVHCPLEDGTVDTWDAKFPETATVAELTKLWLAAHDGVPGVVMLEIKPSRTVSRPRGDVEVKAFQREGHREAHLQAVPQDPHYAEKGCDGELAAAIIK